MPAAGGVRVTLDCLLRVDEAVRLVFSRPAIRRLVPAGRSSGMSPTRAGILGVTTSALPSGGTRPCTDRRRFVATSRHRDGSGSSRARHATRSGPSHVTVDWQGGLRRPRQPTRIASSPAPYCGESSSTPAALRRRSARGSPPRPAGHRLRPDLHQQVAVHAVEEEMLRVPHRPAGGRDRFEPRPGEGPRVRAPLPPRIAIASPRRSGSSCS